MGMVFSRGQSGYFVPAPQAYPRSVTLRSDPRGDYRYDPEFADLRKLGKPGPYSFWSSAKYTLVLSVMLWWIPTFGQMIAGYVGGRKAGNHWKAAVAAFLPVAIIWVLSLLVITTATFPELVNLGMLPAMAAYGLGDLIPFLDPYIHFLVEYLTSFVLALRETAFMGLNGYLVTIIFAYIGGLIADQVSRERANREHEASEPGPPLLAPYEYEQPRVANAVPRPRLAASGGPPWYRVHQEEYSHYQRLPPTPRPYAAEEEYYEPPPRRAPPPRRSPPPREERYDERYADGYDEPPRWGSQREPRTERPRGGEGRLNREELIRRLVERALRDYDSAVG